MRTTPVPVIRFFLRFRRRPIIFQRVPPGAAVPSGYSYRRLSTGFCRADFKAW